MEQLIEYGKSYKEYKAELDGELQKTAEGFVRIGYLLKVARDTNILEESGYKTVSEFAEAEYNLNKTQVSRFMSINDKFSKDGYSEELEDRYKGFGYAKLTIMLQLPDEVNQELTPEYSKADIQAVKEEVEEEKKVSDIELMLEDKPEHIAEEESEIQKVIKALAEQDPELYEAIHLQINKGEWGKEVLKEHMAPDGDKIYSVRIPGTGRFMISCKEKENVTVTSLRTNEKSSYDWEEVMSAWSSIIFPGNEPEESWKAVFFSEYPLKKVPVAPVQQKKEEKKPEKKKSRVEKAKKPEIKKQEEEEKPVNTECEEQQEVQIPGQDNIMNHPEYLPEEMQQHENVTENSEIVERLPMPVPVEDVPAAVVEEENAENTECEEDLRELWRDAENSSREVYGFFNYHTSDHVEQPECTLERLKEVYKNAVDTAAALERMIHVKKHITGGNR